MLISKAKMSKPLVIVPACVNRVGVHANHTAQLKYVGAVTVGADCMPLILPALGDAADLDTVLDAVDGVMLTGSPSNVHPSLYCEEPLGEQPFDAARDATTLPLIRAVLARGMPLLAICRGFQELNVALAARCIRRCITSTACRIIAKTTRTRWNSSTPPRIVWCWNNRGGYFNSSAAHPRSWSIRCMDRASPNWHPA